MPNIKSAKKRNKQKDVKHANNRAKMKQIEDIMNKAAKGGKGTKKDEMVSKAYSLIDKAAKTNVIHENKAARYKHQVSRLLAK
jgi:small subunit ribosomal protein S20